MGRKGLLLSLLVLGLIAIAVVGLVVRRTEPLEPNLPSKTYSSASLRFSYPADWHVDTDFDQHNPDGNIKIVMVPDGFVHITIYEPEGDLDHELEATRMLYADDDKFRDWQAGDEFLSYCSFKGKGRHFELKVRDEPGHFLVFETRLSSKYLLEVSVLYSSEDLSRVSTGLKLIESTLRVQLEPGR